MITFLELRWSNVFSYGENNRISFISSPLTQLVGKNGHGKSSIANILEEVLFNTNSKQTRRAKVRNRYSKAKTYSIELDFDKDGVAYSITTTRNATTGTVKILRNSEDISCHTATATYKLIEETIGFDHKTFSQMVYQCRVSDLEFLTASDSNRKKFLITLLDLSKYTRASEVFSKLNSAQAKEVTRCETQLQTLEASLAKIVSWSKLSPKELKPVPEVNTAKQTEVVQLQQELKVLDSTIAKINRNNTHIQLRDAIDITPFSLPVPSSEVVAKAQEDVTLLTRDLSDAKKHSTSCSASERTCHACGQTVDQKAAYEVASSYANKIPSLTAQLSEAKQLLAKYTEVTSAHSTYLKRIADWEKYSALIDNALSTQIPSEEGIKLKIKALEAEITKESTSRDAIIKYNREAEVHNTKLELMLSQVSELEASVAKAKEVLSTTAATAADCAVLAKAFSTTGLVAYKLECLVKDLEALTNEYLSDMADGRFQLSFKINDSDKLNVIITDAGEDIEIKELSSGELARVNISTLLAIRKLMQSISSSRTNLLILDETVENLDQEGKERLIEVLLKEESLNTFLISHGFSHPLLEKITVTKTKNFSRIE